MNVSDLAYPSVLPIRTVNPFSDLIKAVFVPGILKPLCPVTDEKGMTCPDSKAPARDLRQADHKI